MAVADLGTTLPEALADRYLRDAQEQASNASNQTMYLQTASKRELEVQLLGEDQIRDHQAHLELATQATLDSERVSSIGPPGVLHGTAPNLQELSLAANLLASWDEVSRLAEELPLLDSLDLSWNRMAFPAVPSDNPQYVFAALRRLVLNHCCIGWEQVTRIEKVLPALDELRLSGNGISHLPTSIEGFTNLRTLDLSNNAIREWAVVRPLCRLPSLRSLSLNDNQIATILASTAPGTEFQQLECLFLGNNRIHSWGSIDALTCFSKLKELRLSGNPLTPSGSKEERFEVIARLPDLVTLNASAISPYERKESELRYMREILGELEGLTNDSNAQARLRAMHPCLVDLQAKYGDTGAPAAVAANASCSLGSTLLQLRLTCTATCATSTSSVTKKLPKSMNVRKLKQLCERLFKLPAQQQALTAVDTANGSNLMSLGHDDEAVLGSFNFLDGAELLVTKLDVEAVEQEAAQKNAALAAEHELRLSQQTKGMEILKAVRDEQLVGSLGLPS
ncbi:Tubulin-specific chaperone E [Coccomyxa sp. Obi]|nr:Tubulin-specific chaperone E [Coccomyxa sp. Obi]